MRVNTVLTTSVFLAGLSVAVSCGGDEGGSGASSGNGGSGDGDPSGSSEWTGATGEPGEWVVCGCLCETASGLDQARYVGDQIQDCEAACADDGFGRAIMGNCLPPQEALMVYPTCDCADGVVYSGALASATVTNCEEGCVARCLLSMGGESLGVHENECTIKPFCELPLSDEDQRGCSGGASVACNCDCVCDTCEITSTRVLEVEDGLDGLPTCDDMCGEACQENGCGFVAGPSTGSCIPQ